MEYIAQAGGRIAGETVQTVLFGENADTVFVIPNEGYIFSSWSDGSKNAERRDSNVTSDLSVTARFDKIRVCVRYGTSGGGKIVNSSGDTVFSIGAARPKLSQLLPTTGMRLFVGLTA